MNGPEDIRCRQDDAAGLLQEIIRRDKIIDALAYQVERNLNDQDRDYGLLQTTFVLEEQIRQRTEELTTTLEALGEVSARATAARQQLETAVENISDGFVLFDSQDRVLLCNEAFRRLWGLTGQSASRPFGDFLAEAASEDSAAGNPLQPRPPATPCSPNCRPVAAATNAAKCNSPPGRPCRSASTAWRTVAWSASIPTSPT